MRPLARPAIAVVLGLGLGLAGVARADIWGYVDERGVAHFASEKVDSRYELFLRTGPAPGAAPAAAASQPPPRAVAVPTVPVKLLAFFEVSPNYKSVKHLLRSASQQYNLDYELLKAVIATESGFDPQAVSPKGAIGLMQVIPDTAVRYGVSADRASSIERKLADPAINIRTGSRFLRYLINLFQGRLDLALAAYNAGEGAVQRAGNRIPNYPETQNYVKTVLQLYEALKPPAAVVDQRRQVTPSRMQAATRAPGGALGRGNMIPPLGEPGLPVAEVPAPGNPVPSGPAPINVAPAQGGLAPRFEIKIERD